MTQQRAPHREIRAYQRKAIMKVTALIVVASLIAIGVLLLCREPIIARWFPERGHRINASRDRRLLKRTLRKLDAAYDRGENWTRQDFVVHVSRHLPRQIELPWPQGLTKDERDWYAARDQEEIDGRIEWLVSRGWDDNPRNRFVHSPVEPTLGHRS